MSVLSELGLFAGREKRQIAAFGQYIYMVGGVVKKEATDVKKSLCNAEREHALLALTPGVKQMICCGNKIESTNTTRKYSKRGYEEISEEVSSYLKKVGHNPDRIPLVPISGFEGDSMTDMSSSVDRYEGPVLLEALDLISEPKGRTLKQICFALQDIYTIGGIEVVLARSCVETGVINTGIIITFGFTSLTTEVKPVEMHHKTLLESLPGDNVGFNVKNVAGEIGNGYAPVLDCHTSHIVVKSVVIIFEIEKRSENDIRKNVDIPLGHLAGREKRGIVAFGREKRGIVAFGHYIYTLGGGVDKCMLKGVSEAADTNKRLFKYAVVLDKFEAACNKIESTNTTRKYSNGSCEKSSDVVSSYLKKVGYNPDRIPFVANSGFEGDDMTVISSSMDWYEGPILRVALDSISEPKGRTLKQLCFALQDVYTIGGIEAVPARSCVETGVINTGIVITFGFTSLTTEVKPVEMHHKTLLESLPGDNVGFNVKNVAGEIGNGYAPVLDCHTSHIVVKSVVIIFEIEKRSENDIRKNVDICFATVTPFCEFPPLGHLAGREKRQIVAFDHYVYTLGGVDKRMLTCLSEAADMNKRLFKYAVVLDKLEAACNKIESTNTTRKYSKGSWEKSSDEVSSYLKKVGYKTDKIPFVPISGFEGDNMIELSSRLKELDLISESKGATVKPLCFVLQNVYITGCIEVVRVRCLETGEIKPDVVCTFGYSRCGTLPEMYMLESSRLLRRNTELD